MLKKLKIPAEIKTLGEALRYAREQKGLTLRALARAVEVSAPFVSDLEHNRRTTTDERLADFAKHLGLDVEELQRRSGKIPQDIQDWIKANPEMVQLLKDIRASGRSPQELRVAIRKRRRRGGNP